MAYNGGGGSDRFLVHQIVGSCFSFYSDEEIKRISVKQVTSPVAFDAMQHPIQGGLYDPALGPTDPHSMCPTCRQISSNCPGHLGHIELMVPVYHPLLIVHLFKLLKSKCLACHRFKMAATRARVYRCRLLLTDCGMLKEAMGLDDELDGSSGDSLSREEEAARRDKILSGYEKHCRRLFKSGKCKVGGVHVGVHARELRRAIIGDFLRAMPTKSCHNCQAPGVGLRKDGYTKFFKNRVSEKAAGKMRTLGLSYTSAMEIVSAQQGEDTGDDVWMEGGSGGESGSGSGSDSESGDEETKGSDSKRDRPQMRSNAAAFLAPTEVESQMRLLWQAEKEIVNLIWAPAILPRKLATPEGWRVFFLHVLPVAPARFRPPTKLGDNTFEHPQNFYLAKILNLNQQLARLAGPGAEGEDAAARLDLSKALSVWIDMQESVNSLLDSAKSSQTHDAQAGVRQLLEKKAGLFRQNMMGKRVNYAARSVISPDPYIQPNQIGVPVAFAKKLTYAQPVTPWNVEMLRAAVINGPESYPGANFVEDEAGRLVDLSKRDRHQREALSKTLLTPSTVGAASAGSTCKRVWRHLITNDVVLMNRQPTLHKPSIMAHRARVLRNSNQKTIRMHYANCNTYNADFDGDEMNMHFPQDELARAEAYEIAATPFQYCVPTDGAPLRGLIQDHVDMGVRLCMRDTLLTRDQYQQLVYAAVTALPRFSAGSTARIPTLPPAIILPKRRWTGKQVISTLLKALIADEEGRIKPGVGLCMDGKCKISAASWGVPRGAKFPDEEKLTVRGGELLTGVLDKAQLGSKQFSLIHCVHELYGPMAASHLLSALGRLLTVYLQKTAVTCGLDDLLLTPTAEAKRRELIDSARTEGVAAAAKFAGLDEADAEGVEDAEWVTTVRHAVQQKLTGGEACAEGAAVQLAARLDDAFKGVLANLHSKVIDACLPAGQVKPFPVNNLSLIIFSGAKGSLVNHAMISCGLGQQELEGRRVPVMTSGKTLPSFAPYDPNPRAGGYIGDRFLTGLRPQEYFFHCMSGREGLVDTAVKTSRSGYLQRCIMKHLEDLSVRYDYSVRDSDGNLLQFVYGDDGMDVTKTNFLQGSDGAFSFIARNHEEFTDKYNLHSDFFATAGLDVVTAAKHHRAVERAQAAEEVAKSPATLESAADVDAAPFEFDKRAEVVARRLHDTTKPWGASNMAPGWHKAVVSKVRGSGGSVADVKLDLKYLDGTKAKKVPLWLAGAGITVRPVVPDPVNSQLSLCGHIGSVSEQLQRQLSSYTQRNPDGLLADSNDDTSALSKLSFTVLLWVKFLRSIVDPGEPVGTLAAQSVGEPSTQMTLNTFHLAGHGGVNVTLGIPRLREIIMTASQHIRTPSMTLPLLRSCGRLHANTVARALGTLRLSDLIAWHRPGGGLRVTERFCPEGTAAPGSPPVVTRFATRWERAYSIRVFLSDQGAIQRTFQLSFRKVAAAVGRKFAARLLSTISHDVRKAGGAKKAAPDSTTEPEEGDGVRVTRVAVRAAARAAAALAGNAPPPAPAAGDDDEDSEAGSDSDDEAEAGVSGAGHKKKDKSYAEADDEEKELIKEAVGEDSDDSDDDAKASSGSGSGSGSDEEDDDSEDEEGTSSSDEEMGAASPAQKKRKGNSGSAKAAKKKKGKASGTTFGDKLPAGTKLVEVPGSVQRNPMFCICYANKSEGWVEVVLTFPASFQKILMLDAAERAADKTLVRATKGVERAVVVTQRIKGEQRMCVQTEGVNLGAAAGMSEFLDIHNLDTNDIGAVLHHYGVEACRAAIVKEVKAVFGVYGISVDARHLGLIADYMTQSGGFRAFNRVGIEAQSSPLLKMSFETTTKFLTEACLHGERESITSPAASIVVGRNVNYGTGAFDVLAPLDV